MEWSKLLKSVSRNISYWSYYVCKHSTVEKEDANQELIIILWKQYCTNKEKNKKTTTYYMQKRLEYGAYRIIQNSRLEYEESEYDDELCYNPFHGKLGRELFHSNYVNDIFIQLKRELLEDKEFKALDILIMILEGKKNKEISEIMDMKANTFSLYVKRKIKDSIKEIVGEPVNVN